VLRRWWEQLRAGLGPSEPEEFTLDDFMAQMGQVKKLGGIGRVMCMIPGMSELTKNIGMNEGDVEGQMRRMFAIYESMTMAERLDVDLLNGSRRRRIANGARVRTIEVAQLARQFQMSRDMMRRVSGRG
jgi:signal recognition particle subunit SRP54